MSADGEGKYEKIVALLEELKAVADSTERKVDVLYNTRHKKNIQERLEETKAHVAEREAKRKEYEETKRTEERRKEAEKEEEEAEANALAYGVLGYS